MLSHCMREIWNSRRPAESRLSEHDATQVLLLLWSPYGIGQTIIFSSCRLFFLSSFFFFSSPNLSRRRLDVCHTSTHGVALVRISDTGLKPAARGSLKHRMQKSRKNRHLGTIAQLCRAISSQLRHISTIGKKLVKQQYVLKMSSQHGELRPTSG